MINNILDNSKIREMFKNMSLSQRMEVIETITQEGDQVRKVEERRKTFIQTVTDWGYSSPTDFLIECEFISNPSVKRQRMGKETRLKVVEDIKSKTLTNQQISEKHGVSVDSVYNIRSKEGLSTNPRTKSEPTQSSPPSVPSVVPSTDIEKQLIGEQFDKVFGTKKEVV